MAVSWDPQIQVTSVLLNHLIAGILETVGSISLLRNFRKDRCSQARSRIMIGSDSRRGSWSCANCIQEISESHTVLHAQCDFLCSQGKLEWAATVVRQAGQLCAQWIHHLTDLYIDLGQYESALFTLNSCPMFSFDGRDMYLPLSHRAVAEILLKTEDDAVDILSCYRWFHSLIEW